MKKFVCELCGGNEVAKKDNVFICKSCNCEYSSEEVKKLMVEVDDINSDVSSNENNINSNSAQANTGMSTEARNIMINADNTFNDMNYEEAFKLYSLALNMEPNNTHMIVYRAISSLYGSNIKEIRIAEVDNAFKRAFSTSREQIGTGFEYFEFINDAVSAVDPAITACCSCWIGWYNKVQDARGITISGNLATMGIANEAKKSMQNGISQCCDTAQNIIRYAIESIENYSESCNEFWDALNTILESTKNNYERAKMSVPSSVDELKVQLIDSKRKAKDSRINFALSKNATYWNEHTEEREQLNSEMNSVIAQLDKIDEKIETVSNENNEKIEKMESEKEVHLDIDDQILSQQEAVSAVSSKLKEKTGVNLAAIKEKAVLTKQLAEEEAKLLSLKNQAKKERKELVSNIDERIAFLKKIIQDVKDEKESLMLELDSIVYKLAKMK